MRWLRPFLIALILSAIFFYITTYRSSHPPLTSLVSRPDRIEITEAASSGTEDAEEQNNISVYRKNVESVVNITSRAMAFDFFYGLQPQEGQGSGFIIDKEGHILTNYHVVQGAQTIEVTLGDQSRYKAKYIGADSANDIALIQIDMNGRKLTPLSLGDSRTLQVGQRVEHGGAHLVGDGMRAAHGVVVVHAFFSR